MDYYDFAVTQFTIHDTRALLKDTLQLSHSASVDDPSAKVGFAFQLLNAGNASDSTLSGRVAATADHAATPRWGQRPFRRATQPPTSWTVSIARDFPRC
jgi:hypothetical protein